MSPTDQIQELFDRALSSVLDSVTPSPRGLHQRLLRRRLRTRVATLGSSALAVAVGATAVFAGTASVSSAVTLYPTSALSIGGAQLIADQQVMTARLHAVGFPSATVRVEHGTLVVTNGPRDLGSPASFLTSSPELLIRSVKCYAGTERGPVSTNPLPVTCSNPKYAAPVAPFGTSTVPPAVAPDPALSAFATTTPRQDAASPNAFALLPILTSNSASAVQRYLVGPTLLTLSSKVATASVVRAPMDGGWLINVRLNARDSQLWDQVAKANFHRKVAIDLNGVIVTAPLIQPNNSSFGSFKGQMQLIARTKSGAYDLAAALTTGPLAVPLTAHKTESEEAPHSVVITASLRLNSLLVEQFPDQYAGISLSNDNATINIYVTSSTSRLTSLVRNDAPPDSVNYVTVVNTWRSLLAVHRKLESSLTGLAAQGIHIADFSPDVTANREVIEVVKPTTKQIVTLDHHFGANLIEVQGIAANQVPVPVAASWGSGMK